MSKARFEDLEQRVARLERLLNRVLELIQEIRAEMRGEEGPAERPKADVSAKARVEAEPHRPAPGQPGGEPGFLHGALAGGGPDAAYGVGGEAGQARPPGHRVDARSTSFPEGLLSLKGPGLSRLGIVLLLLSVAFFFKYSIDQGWLVPWTRIAIGLGAGVALVSLGFRGALRGEYLGMALAGGGIATFFITGYAAHQWYSLVPYPIAFGLLVLVSALGVFLSLRSGRQTLAMVGLIGALATPVLLTPEKARIAGLALYVALIVGTIVGIYLARAWRALLVAAVLASWPVLAIPILGGFQGGPLGSWALQIAVLFCALAFWVVPVVRALLAAEDPERWPRPGEGGVPGRGIPWSAHLDAFSLLMPLVAILLSSALWDLSKTQAGWCFLGGALLAQGFGWWISRRNDPEESVGTQWFVALALSTVGLGLVLSGDILYSAFIAEAAVLLVVGSRKDSRVLLGMGVAVWMVVASIFFVHISSGGRLLDGEVSASLDLAALGAAAIAATQLRDPGEKRFLLLLAYVGLLAWTARELLPLEGGQALTSLAFGLEGTLLLAAGHATGRSLAQKTGMATLLLVVAKLLLVDMAAVEPVWRVLLFGLFGTLFLVLSRVVQGRKGGQE